MYRPHGKTTPVDTVGYDEVQSDVLTTDLGDNEKISKLKQLKTETKVPTKAINALNEQLKNAQTSAADALQRVTTFEDDMAGVHESVEAMQTSVDTMQGVVDDMHENVEQAAQSIQVVTEQITALQEQLSNQSTIGDKIKTESSSLDRIKTALAQQMRMEYKDVVAWGMFSGGTPANYEQVDGKVEIPREVDLDNYVPTHVNGVVFANAPMEDNVPIFFDKSLVNVHKSGTYTTKAVYGVGYYSSKHVYPELTYHVAAIGRMSLANWYSNGAKLNNVSYKSATTAEELDVLSEYEVTALTSMMANNKDIVSVPSLTLINDTTTAVSAFSGCTSLVSVGNFEKNHVISDASSMFLNDAVLTTVPEMTVTSACTNMFKGCSAVEDLSMVKINCSTATGLCMNCTSLVSPPVLSTAVKDCTDMFSGCKQLTAVADMNVTTATRMFNGCTGLKSVGQITGTTATSMFAGCTGLTEIPAMDVTTATSMFSGCTGLVTAGDVKATTGTSMFQGCTGLKTAGNVNVSTASSMFSGCSELTKVGNVTVTTNTSMFFDCTKLAEVGNVTCASMSSMFSGRAALTKVGNVNASTTAASAFAGCTSLTSVGTVNSPNMTSMFLNCSALTSVEFNKSTTMNITSAFKGCESLASVGEGTIKPSNIASAFEGCTSLPTVFPLIINVDSLTSEESALNAFKDSSVEEVHVTATNGVPVHVCPVILGVQRVVVVDAKGVEVETRDESFTPLVCNKMYTSGGTSTYNVPAYATKMHVQATSGYIGHGDNRDTYIEHTQSTFGTKLASVADPGGTCEKPNASWSYGQAGEPYGYSAMPWSIFRYNYGNGVAERSASMSSYYYYSPKGRNCYGWAWNNASLVTGDVTVTPGESVSVKVGAGGFRNSTCTLKYFHSGATSEGYIYVHWDKLLESSAVPNPTGDDVAVCVNNAYAMSSLFASNYTTMTTLPKRLNTVKLGTAKNMFSGCAALTQLDLSEMYFAHVIHVDSMFANCAALTELDTSPLAYAQPQTASSMFSGCRGLTEIDLRMDTRRCTTVASMFANCTSLTKVKLAFDFGANTGALTMFAGCSNLQEVDLSECVRFDLARAASMFANLPALTMVKLPKLMGRLSNTTSMFLNCSSLTTIDGVLDFASSPTYANMFSGCSNLTGVKIKNPPSGVTNDSGFAGLVAGQYEIIA